VARFGRSYLRLVIRPAAAASQQGPAPNTPDDAIGLLDAVTATQDYTRAQLDTVGATDARVLDRSTSATDTAGLTDSVGLDVGRSSSDTVGLTDNSAVVQGFARTQTDAVGLLDSSASDRATGTTDPLGVTDSVAAFLISGELATPPERIHHVPAEHRMNLVVAERRGCAVPAERRIS
jgi:hypothetical protein